VRDTGIGIDPKARVQLFSPFVQGDNSRTRKYGGTGLGLAISQQLAGLMGGQIGVESEPGRGSTFWLTLTCGKSDAVLENDGPQELVCRLRGTPGRILVAEDNEINQRIARRLLEKAGHRVDVVPNGRLALEKLAAAPYDVVLMDVQMPEMDGLMTTAEIRKLPQPAANTPIIAMTANAMTGDRERCLEAGMDGFLSKPFNPAEMLQMIQQWMSRAAP
jgi:CheY-like chemotaxis protein